MVQPAADQQHRPALLETAHRVSVPRVAEISRRLAAIRRKVAERQDGGIHPVRPPARGLEQQAVLERAKRRRLVGNQVQVATTAQPRDRVLEKMLDVGAIDLAAHEGAGEAALARGLPLRLRQRCQPAHEMIGLVGERAHVLDAHVQQMARVRGRIGSALAQSRRTLDQVDPVVPGAAPQQVQGHEHAAEPGPDHGDPAAVAGHAIGVAAAGGGRFRRIARKHWNDVAHCCSLPSLRARIRRAAKPAHRAASTERYPSLPDPVISLLTRSTFCRRQSEAAAGEPLVEVRPLPAAARRDRAGVCPSRRLPGSCDRARRRSPGG